MTKVRADGDDLEFDFQGCPDEHVIRLDQCPELTDGPRCDFVIFPPAGSGFILEVKDPCQPSAHSQEKKQFLSNLRIDTNNPLENRLLKGMVFTVVFVQDQWPGRGKLLLLAVFGIECMEEYAILSRALRGTMQTNLHRRLNAHPVVEAGIANVILLTPPDWNTAFPQYPVRRVSAGGR